MSLWSNYSRIEALHQSLTIEEACRRYLPGVELRRRGRRLWACCPFHGEKTPSFMVDTGRGRWKCFGCGLGGDALDLAAAALGVPLAEGIKIMAADLGILRDMDPARRRAARSKIEQERRERAAARRFEDAIATAYIQAAALLRAAYRIEATIKSPADLDRASVAAAFASIAVLEDVLNGLGAQAPAERYRALCRWRGMVAK